MSTITVWVSPSFKVRLQQLSDDPQDGSPQEQIAHLATLSYLEGWSCVDQNFTGSVPAGDASQWRWSDGQIVSVAAVPASVTPRQVRLLLLAQGLLESVEATIASQDQATQITWAYAQEFRRNDPLLTQLGAGMGLTSAQIDQFFIDAAAL